jgi:hypothetical protein
MTVPWSRAGVSRARAAAADRLRCRAHHHAPAADPTIPARIPRVRLFKSPPLEPASRNVDAIRERPLICTTTGVRARTLVRTAPHPYWPLWVSLTWLTVGVLTLCSAAGCRQAVAPIDAAAAEVPATATISGTIRGPERAIPLDGRIVDVINLATNQRRRITTNQGGGFSVRLDPGDYRIELLLRDGEAIVRQPGVIHVDHSDVGADADFVVGKGRISRPRGPAYKVDDGLGSPVA